MIFYIVYLETVHNLKISKMISFFFTLIKLTNTNENFKSNFSYLMHVRTNLFW
jgi:hypothetical protein